MKAIKEYFNKMRHDDKHHLGLGDIRLTIAQQEEIICLIEEKFKKVNLAHVSNNEVSFYCQRDIEGESICEEQCEHCKEYYAPLERQ